MNAKREEALAKKAERKALEREEAEALNTPKRNKGKPKHRMTQFEILQANEAHRKDMEEKTTLSRLEALKLTPQGAYARVIDAPNRNHDTSSFDASGIDNALHVLTGQKPVAGDGSLGPMTYGRFESMRIPSIKVEKPGLKQSQYRELVKKEWQRSKLNPKNAGQ